jgi:cob(I)alamin adenosyltransferase
MRIDKVYTRGGDGGETSLIGGQRVSKASARIDCYGTVDELNAAMGLVRTALAQSAAGPVLLPVVARIQNELFNLGAELAAPDEEARRNLPRIHPRHVSALEQDIDQLNGELPALTSFVLPGGGWASSYLHLARTVSRRAERLVVGLGDGDAVTAVHYLNRLSDALFVLGRWAALKDQEPEPVWRPDST